MVVAVAQDQGPYPTMYATMRTPHHRIGGDITIPDFVPPPPPMFENGVSGAKPPIKPPLPPGKPEKIAVVAKGKLLGSKGEKKRESTV